MLLAAGCEQTNDTDGTAIQRPREENLDTAGKVPRTQPETTGSPTSAIPSALDRDAELATAQQLISKQQFDAAAKHLQNVLFADPSDARALFLLAGVRHAQGDFDQAVDLLGEIPADHADAGLPAIGQAADWLSDLGHFDRAEQKYREVLQRVPTASPALRSLAFILNRQGRRHESAELIRQLCRLGDIQQDELHSLISLSSPMIDSAASLDVSRQAATGQRQYIPIGPGSVARQHLIGGDEADGAASLEIAIAAGGVPSATVALYGRLLAESQDDLGFQRWLQTTDEDVKRHSEYWSAVGAYLLGQRRYPEATRALLEAVERDPTDTTSFSRLSQAYETLGEMAKADQWHEKWELSKKIHDANNRVADSVNPSPVDIERLAELLEQDARLLEGTLWRYIAAGIRGDSADVLSALNQRRLALVANQTAFPDQAERLLGVNLADYPLPVFDHSPVVATASDASTLGKMTPAIFVNASDQIGLDHAYQVAAVPQRNGFAIYQAYGGSVMALDYDLNGQCDLFLTQGGCEGPDFVGDQSDRLYRQLDGRLNEVAVAAGATDFGYTLGGTAGDWNQDGFDDVVLSNIGQCRLLVNNGDGTFSESIVEQESSPNRVPASVAIADISGDSLPDIVELAYVDDVKIMDLPPRDESGNVITPVGPKQYRAGADRVFKNDGRGSSRQESFSGSGTGRDADPRTGLGLVITDFDGDPGNEAFVGNDLCPDQLWSRRADGVWEDLAMVVGCAFGTRGMKTASMGIAAADLDNRGEIDLHITNFQTSNSSLFINSGGVFRERNVQYGLAKASRAVLGFGTQAIDYDNNGRRDLIVTNGHIDETDFLAGDFYQPTQLFCNRGLRYDLVDVSDSSGYFASPHVGRGLARLDFDGDGRLDFAVTHLGEQTALLINQTQSPHRWIRFVLVGTASERDAVGATIEVEIAGGRRVDWVIAGDGYFCRNERAIHFGLGEADKVDRFTVRWPSGRQQTHAVVESGETYLVIEGSDEVFRQQKSLVN